MTLTAAEPAPVLMAEGYTFKSANIIIRVYIRALANNVDTREFVTLLERISFRIIPGLRVKTYYSTQPF